MQTSRIGLPHLKHGRIPISARLCSGFGRIDDICAPRSSAGALPISLSPITACRSGDGPSLAQLMAAAWSILTKTPNLVRGVSSGQHGTVSGKVSGGTVCLCLFRLEVAQAHQGSETTAWQALQRNILTAGRQPMLRRSVKCCRHAASSADHQARSLRQLHGVGHRT
jgi:hypothetical protein